MGLKEFNELVKDIRTEIKAHGIDFKSEQLEFEIAREIAKHYNTLKQYDIIQILNEISDNLDSALNVSENLTIAKQIIYKYLGANKYTVDYVESMEKALQHWNNKYAEELTQQYLEKEAENATEWQSILRTQENAKTKPLLDTNNVAKSNKSVTQQRRQTVKVVKYKPDLSEVKSLNEKVNTLESRVASIDMKLTQFMDMVNNNNNNKELIEKIGLIENGINGLRQGLNTYKEENEVLKAKIAQLEKRLAELEQRQNAYKDRQDQLEILLSNILIAEIREFRAELRDLKREQMRGEFRPTVKNNRTAVANRQRRPRPRQSKYDILLNEINGLKKDVTELKVKVENIEQKTTPAQPQAQPQTQPTNQVNKSRKDVWKARILKFALALAPNSKYAPEIKERLKNLEQQGGQVNTQANDQDGNQPASQTQTNGNQPNGQTQTQVVANVAAQ
jgi:chromosome segregation ATPase